MRDEHTASSHILCFGGTTMGALPGISDVFVGHATNETARTGWTGILCPRGAVAGVDVRGGGPATRGTDLLRPGNLVKHIQAVLLTGGSAFGLAAADGVMRYLYERGVGFDAGVARVPIVPAASLFDLAIGPVAWPDADAGYAACEAATAEMPAEGSVGAGTGATVGKWLGPPSMVQGGIAFHSLTLPDDVTDLGLVVANPVGDVVDPATGQIVAGARDSDRHFAQTVPLMTAGAPAPSFAPSHTTIGVIATDAALTKAQAYGLARAAHDGIAWAVRPAHTLWDGDTLFALSVGAKPSNQIALGAAAAVAVSQAILRAVRMAESLHGVPAISELADG